MEVKPCPFCDHDDVELDEVDMHCFAVCCPECETIGPVSRESIEHAIDLWNRPHERDFKMDRLVKEARDWNAELWGAPPTGGASHTNAGLAGTEDNK